MRVPLPGMAPRSASPRPAWIVPLFVLSGANGLCFEILWARQLQVVVGATSKAITLVVGLFMVGLALGGALGAHWAPRLRRPAMGYGVAELGIGLSALAVTSLLPRLELLPGLPSRYALATILLLVPSMAMGLTFPFVVQASDPGARSGGGVLYAANTAGALLGCVLAGFVGIGVLGISGTAMVAAGLNLACGVAALSLFRGGAGFSPAPVEADRSPATPAVIRPFSILLAAGLCGAAALASEILWTRALLPHLNSSTYAFAAILATYLAGLAMGAAWVSQRCRMLRMERLALLFGGLQCALAILVALSPRLLHASEMIPGYVGIRQVHSLAGWFSMVAVAFARSACLVLLPTFLMGACLPLCIALLARSGRKSGAAAGQVSAINTLGGVAGSFCAGFVLLPRLGVVNSMALVGLLNLAAATAALAPFARARGWIPRLAIALAAVAVALFVARPLDTTPFLGRLAKDSRVIFVNEGPQDTTAVIELPTRDLVILSNGVSYAGDAPPARRYMALLGQLPAILSEDPGKAMVICVGTGTTAANLALYREVRALDLVDISPAVHRTLPYFLRVNHGVWTDPRVSIHEADGRQFMTRGGAGYGAITLEPPPPRAAGAASLYTVELYRRARASLRPGGIVAQWLPLHGMTETEILMLARSFLAVFPDSALFLLNPNEAALLGSPGSLAFNGARMARRLAEPAARIELAQVGFSVEDGDRLLSDVLALAVAFGADLRALVGDGPLVTDDRPLIEQFATLLRDTGDPDGRRGLLRRIADLPIPALPLQGLAPAALAEAQQAMRARVRSWLADHRAGG